MHLALRFIGYAQSKYRLRREWLLSAYPLRKETNGADALTFRAGALPASLPAGDNGGTARFACKLIGEREAVREQTTNSRSGGPIFANDHRSVSTSQHQVTVSAGDDASTHGRRRPAHRFDSAQAAELRMFLDRPAPRIVAGDRTERRLSIAAPPPGQPFLAQ